MNTDYIEILAPAGSFESLRAAINAKCDSVYFGVAEMNMRASAAKNFALENLQEVVNLCKENGVNSLLTVNTLLYNNELSKMREIVDAAKKTGVTAIIAADMATIKYAQSIGVNVQISTQLSISNTESLKFYSQFADCVVLARELTLEQIRQISIDIKGQNIRGPKGEYIRLEVFAHGALCVAVSGRCAMSLYCSETSANRGKCAQICRRQFKVTDIDTDIELIVDNNYVMSAADLCTIGMLPELIDAGANVLKFEGRGRSPEYVDTVIRTYREALNAIEKGQYTEENIKKWNKELGTVFNRGLHEGLYRGLKFSEWAGTHGSKATKERVQIGVVEHYYPKVEVAQVLVKDKNGVKEDEEFLIIGPTTGVMKGSLNKMQVDEDVIQEAKKGDVITFQVDGKVRKNDKFFVLRERKSLIPKGRESLIQKS